MNPESLHNIDSYTDDELYTILDLDDPSDPELENRILFLFQKYRNMQNRSGDQLAEFFQQIHRRFFSVDEEEEEAQEEDEYKEGFTGNTNVSGVTTIQGNASASGGITIKGNDNSTITRTLPLYNYNDIGNNQQYNITIAPDTAVAALAAYNESADAYNAVLSGNVQLQSQYDPTKQQTTTINQPLSTGMPVAKSNATTQNAESSVAYTKSLDYTPDKTQMNPILKETVKRIISIDSQYRDDKRSLSTDFTFNLNETLKGVVSLKLYSIQIPYTWYTINNNFGSNFFYLKGNAPGINDGNHDFKLEITAGNYLPGLLADAINASFVKIKATNTDVSFGNQNLISYNPPTSLATFTIDITNQFNETAYYVRFPTWTTPYDNNADGSPGIQRSKSIPGFLGFDSPIIPYYSNQVYSNPFSPNQEVDTRNSIYPLTATNNYITIIKYTGPDEYNPITSVIDISFTIKLTGLTNSVTRSQLVAELNTQLQNSTYLLSADSTIQLVPISDLSNANYGKSCYQITITPNRFTTNNLANSKMVIQFPDETVGTSNPIWRGAKSCFQFPDTSKYSEVNNIISNATPVSQQSGRYTISTSPYIKLTCIRPMYTGTINDISFTIVNSPGEGYLLSDYIAAINNSINVTNNRIKATNRGIGDLNMTTTEAYIDNNTSFFHLNLDINRSFTQEKYQVDLTGSYLSSQMGLPRTISDASLAQTNLYTNYPSSFSSNATYFIDSSFIAIVSPASSRLYGNRDAPSYIVPSPTNRIYNSYVALKTAINDTFNNFTDNGVNVLSGTSIDIKFNTITQYLDCSFTVSVQTTLTERDYHIQFVDTSPTSNSWVQNFNLDPAFTTDGIDLQDALVTGTSYADISGSKAVTQNKIVMDTTNNKIQLVPYRAGVTGSSTIELTIPPGQYTRTAFIDMTNSLLTAEPLTKGSVLSIVSINGSEYAKFRFTINKVYRASDYNLVFYDPFSFVKCFVGAKSVRNTTWDTTMGWILGFRKSTIYSLAGNTYEMSVAAASAASINYNITPYTIVLSGDTTVSVNLFSYFLLCLDDYNQNHLNDGLVSISSKDVSITMPSYANRSQFKCDPTTGELVYNVQNSGLTEKQIYALTETMNNRLEQTTTSSTGVNSKSYGTGPFAQDVFGLIPVKTAGQANGSVYIEFGGTLQNQERSYFGPVNINRMSVKLVSDRGDVVDLNGSNWSFSLICEQLYTRET